MTTTKSAAKALLAAIAGARGRSAQPMNVRSTTARSSAYHRQNGCVKLTPRQLRRMQQKYRKGLQREVAAA